MENLVLGDVGDIDLKSDTGLTGGYHLEVRMAIVSQDDIQHLAVIGQAVARTRVAECSRKDVGGNVGNKSSIFELGFDGVWLGHDILDVFTG